ncbi:MULTISPECIES: CDP-diacylglycerol--serine O-phosphatidyltransferase [Exiguobacterium]|uniref:CDP-diacylglycerol--serine O-phosphatidyltransferase n=1 Tax=Exiguobacterium TaxID=33986 RepID=UPI001BE78D84|nr:MULTISPECIES: CDP-diacylglycerol--serine O-phosphatidyltransferase [Exiguobacterium]MCT4784163.1 CDP-diacylglycerol--serine O-phosphatidyltransferase [Exiguobacterium himgiriensis]
MWKERIRSWVPNSFTFGNLFCGVIAIVYAASGDFSNATLLIIIAMMLDSLDGRLARMLGVAGDFGKELDSLADVVTFGVAPALLAYYTFFIDYGNYGLFFAALFPLFGAYRLARFNLSATNVTASYFSGVPITAAGGLLAVVTTFGDRISELLTPIFFTGLALLMVSRVRIPSFKEVPLPRHSFIITVSLVYLTYMIFARWKEWPSFWFIAVPFYILFIAFSFVKKRKSMAN